MNGDDANAKLEYLLDRLAISDVIQAYARSQDRLDKELFESTYHADALDDHVAFVGDRDEFYAWASGLQAEQRHSTMHLVANQTVEIDGDCAHAETYYVSYAMNKQGAPFSAVGGRYIDRLEREDGVWKIRHRLLLVDWEMPAVNTREAVEAAAEASPLAHLGPRERATAATRLRGTRDRNDPSYQRPFEVSQDRLATYRGSSDG